MTQVDLNLKRWQTIAYAGLEKLSLGDIEMDRVEDHIAKQLVYSLRASIVSEIQKPFVYSVHENWFEHLKERFFPAWALKKWPVKRKEVSVPISIIWPKLNTAIPPSIRGPYFTVFVNERPMGTFLSDLAEPTTPLEFELSMREKREYSFTAGPERKCPCCRRAFRE